MLVAVAVILSSFSIPIGASRCFPIQHMVNVIAAVFLGPVYGVSMAFCTALIRNLLGTGSLLAFPGSMVGAFVSAMVFKYTKAKIGAYIGEVFGTGILGGMLCYPIASMMMGQKELVEGGVELLGLVLDRFQDGADFIQAFRHNGIEHRHGPCTGLGGTYGAEFEFIACEGKGAGAVPVGGVQREHGIGL